MKRLGEPARTVVAVAAAGGCAQAALATTPALPLVLLPLSAGALLGAVWWSARVAGVPPRTRRAVTGVANTLAVLLVGAALLTAGRSADVRDLSDHLGPALLALQLLHAATWRTARDLRAAMVVSGGMLVLAAADVREPLAGLPVVAGWAALVAAAVCLGQGEPGRRAAARAVLDRPGPRPHQVLPATGLAVLVGLALFLVVPLHLATPSRSTGAGQPATAGGLPAPRSGSLRSDRMDLRSRGDLGTRPVLQVPADSPSHWRSTAYATYDGSGWSVAGTAPRPVPTGRPGARSRTDDVRALQPDGTVWAPGEPIAVRAPGTTPVEVGPGVVRLGRAVRAYSVTSQPAVADPALLRAAATGPTSAADLQLPAGLPDRVRRLGEQLVQGAPTRYDAVQAVAAYVRGAATYRLDSPVPAPGEDAVDRFLFVDRVGFCEQFASAETVLLRAGGVPARLVTGLAGTEGEGLVRTYRTGDLHAWVEVPYGQLGWSLSDPTPSGSPPATSPRARLDAAVTAVTARVDRLPGRRYALAGALLLVCALGTAAGRLARRPRRVPAGPVAPAGRPALAAFLRLDRRSGPARRRPAESLAEMGGRLDLPPSAVAVVERECYAPPGDPLDAADAVRALDTWRPDPG